MGRQAEQLPFPMRQFTAAQVRFAGVVEHLRQAGDALGQADGLVELVAADEHVVAELAVPHRCQSPSHVGPLQPGRIRLALHQVAQRPQVAAARSGEQPVEVVADRGG